jgi:hypothetical protein
MATDANFCHESALTEIRLPRIEWVAQVCFGQIERYLAAIGKSRISPKQPVL